ncbi:unnamed protein product [Effrenium voratum]|nr:unnamed protein product [Effrenium voratum]
MPGNSLETSPSGAMPSVPVKEEHKEKAVEDALRSTPPDEWSSILEGLLGTSFRPVQSQKVPEEAFTVTSLLAKMNDAPPDVVESRPASMAGRRRSRQKPPETTPQEDDRPLEDLLRDLGETSGPKPKKKSGKKPNAPKQEPLAPAKSKPEPQAASAEPEDEAEEEPPGPVPEEGWETVPTKEARKAASKAARAERAAVLAVERAAESAMAERAARARIKRAETQDSSCTGSSTSLEHQLCAAKPSPPVTKQHAAAEKPAVTPSTEDTATEASCSDKDKEDKEDKEDGEDKEVDKTLATVTTETDKSITASPSTEAEGLVESAMSSEGESSQVRRRSRSEGMIKIEFELEEVSAVNAASPSSASGWQMQPSVGTWLRSADAGRQGSPVGQLWPATPESTPPASPRYHGIEQVVWMPIPTRLVAEVQQLINCRMLQSSSSNS